MVDRGLHFLDPRNVVGAHNHRKIAEIAPQDFAAVVAEKRDSQKPTFAGFSESEDDVARTAAGGNADGDIVWLGLRDELAKENPRRKIRSVPLWFLPKAPAPPIILTTSTGPSPFRKAVSAGTP